MILRLEGIMASMRAARSIAKRKLKNKTNGKILICAYNGNELFIKKSKRIFISSKKEFNNFFKY
jgi:hypothetical protein